MNKLLIRCIEQTAQLLLDFEGSSEGRETLTRQLERLVTAYVVLIANT